MRNINRISVFTQELNRIWATYFSDWRFGQFMYNLITETGDPFFHNEAKMLKVVKEYIREVTGKEVE